MKICKSTARLLSQYRRDAKYFLLTNSGRFYIFLENVTVEGQIKEKVENTTIFHLPKAKDKEVIVNKDEKSNILFERIKKHNNNKYTYDIKNGDLVTFTIKHEIAKELKKVLENIKWDLFIFSENKELYAQLLNGLGGDYNEETGIIEFKADTHESPRLKLSNFSGQPCVYRLGLDFIKYILKDTFEVEVLNNRVLIFGGVETGLTYYFLNKRSNLRNVRDGQ